MKYDELIIGRKYNWKGQSERLIYLGYNWSGNGYWFQFAKVDEPEKVWCEVLMDQLSSFEETKEPNSLDEIIQRSYDNYFDFSDYNHKKPYINPLRVKTYLSARQYKKLRKAERRQEKTNH